METIRHEKVVKECERARINLIGGRVGRCGKPHLSGLVSPNINYLYQNNPLAVKHVHATTISTPKKSRLRRGRLETELSQVPGFYRRGGNHINPEIGDPM
jgi:hypothetical protein